jgi:uncharacterized protein (TIGR03435 family)
MTRRRVLTGMILIQFLLLFGSVAEAQTVPPVTLRSGSSAPDLALEKILQSPAGARADWESLRGKVVVLEFWATWCAPCLAVQPHLNDLVDTFQGKPVQFISITNEDEARVASFLKRRTLKGWVGLDLDRSAQKAYGAFAIPKTVVVDPRGNIAVVTHASKLSPEMIDQILAGTFSVATDKPAEPPVKSSEAKPAEAASAYMNISLKPSKESALVMMMSGFDRLEATGADLKALLSSLLGVSPAKIFLPAELEGKRYDIAATFPKDKQGHHRPLLVNALEIALGFKVKREVRAVDAFILTAPKELTGSLQPSTATSFHVSSARGILAGAGADFGAVVRNLENVLNAPVIDETNLRGKFDWDLVFDDKNPASIIDAVRKDFGLTMTPGTRQVEVVVVDIGKS